MELQREHKNKSKKIVGRGGTRGKTSGRGHKGQKQHGGTPRPAMRDVLKKIPKLRGYKFNSIKAKPLTVNLSDLEKHFTDGETVNPSTLVDKGVFKSKNDRVADVKILADGELTKKLTIEQCAISLSAIEKVKAAGGSVNV